MKKILLYSFLLLLSSLCRAELNWEAVGNTPAASTFKGEVTSIIYRAKVPHGWFIIVNQYNGDIKFVSPSNITFYPDEQHQWKIGSNDEAGM